MPKLFITGLGAVSPAGWGILPLSDALQRGEPLPIQPLERPGWDKPLKIRLVPPPPTRPAFFSHARLRRVSPLTQYAAAAAMEAISSLPEGAQRTGLGMIFCLQIGPVQYASRFYQEVLTDPATSSPLLFPETVFSAPASHVAALLGTPPLVHTLMGDPAIFLHAIAMAAEWLNEGRVQHCLVVGAEEFNWLQADAARHFDSEAIFGPGAAAVCLGLQPPASGAVEIETITDVQSYGFGCSQQQAALKMRQQLPPAGPDDLLCDGLGGAPRPSTAEQKAWQNWKGRRISPKRILGEGLMAAAGWQVVTAAHAVSLRQHPAAIISLVGCNQQAIGARLISSGPQATSI